MNKRNELIQRHDELSRKGWLNLSRDELKELVEITKYLERN